MGLDIMLYKAMKRGQRKNPEYLIFEKELHKKEIEILRKAGFEPYFHEIENEYYDLIKDYPGWEVIGIIGEDDENKAHYEIRNKETDETKVLPLDDAPTFKQTDIKIFVKEIGYQRKGMNGKFYETWCKDEDSVIITDRAEIKKICECSNDIKYSKKEFLNKFKEGETFMVLDY